MYSVVWCFITTTCFGTTAPSSGSSYTKFWKYSKHDRLCSIVYIRVQPVLKLDVEAPCRWHSSAESCCSDTKSV